MLLDAEATVKLYHKEDVAFRNVTGILAVPWLVKLPATFNVLEFYCSLVTILTAFDRIVRCKILVFSFFKKSILVTNFQALH